MKKNKLIGVLLLILAVATIVGMRLNDDAFWNIHNYATIIFSGLAGIVLLKQK